MKLPVTMGHNLCPEGAETGETLLSLRTLRQAVGVGGPSASWAPDYMSGSGPEHRMELRVRESHFHAEGRVVWPGSRWYWHTSGYRKIEKTIPCACLLAFSELCLTE